MNRRLAKFLVSAELLREWILGGCPLLPQLTQPRPDPARLEAYQRAWQEASSAAPESSVAILASSPPAQLLDIGVRASLGVLRYHTTDLPADVEIVHVDWDFANHGIVVICRSASFAEIEQGVSEIPTLPVLCQTRHVSVEEVAARLREEAGQQLSTTKESAVAE